MNSKEREAISIPTALKHCSESNGLAAPIFGTRDIKPLCLAQQARAKVMPFSELIIEHRECPEHELLEGLSRRELSPVQDGKPIVPANKVIVVVVLDEVAVDVSPEASEERDIVVIENSIVVVVLGGGELATTGTVPLEWLQSSA